MRRRVASTLATGAAVAMAIGLSATSASAQQEQWTIDPGGDYTATSGETLLTNTRNDVQLVCTSSEAAGMLETGASGTPAQLGSIDQVAFSNCSGPLGLTFEVGQVGSWSINGESFADGVTTGYVGGVEANLTGPGCQATVTGEADGTYDNASGTLALSPVADSGHELVVSSVDPGNNCFGLIQQGDVVEYQGDYAITPAQQISFG
ncbi:MAG: hypothetical protein GEU98_16215 [Pseudonocardiaceae bacterium]|nr:hypothetical protein [Pseudonocardiaceae bacterium]